MRKNHMLGGVTFVVSLLLLLPFQSWASDTWEPGAQRLHSHIPTAVKSLTPTGHFASTNHLGLAIGLPGRNQEALSNLLRDLYDPASPNYRHFLTPAQFTEQFGPSEQDYQALIAFTKAKGLRITATHPNRLLLDVSGSVPEVERALQVTLHTYQHPTEKRTFYSPDTEPTLDLGIPVLHISGLDNFSLPRPHLTSVRLANGLDALPNAGSGPSGGYMGKDFRAAYLPNSTLTGAGQVVGLLQFDGYSASDITYYESKAGLPNVTLTNVLIDGASGIPSGTGGEVETCLDIQMAISIAPGLAKVIVYEAPDGSPFVDILNRMTTDNLAKQLSCSWYIPNGTAQPAADLIFQQMAAQGQSFFNASGDDNAFAGLVPFPGDTPYITQVGGTTLTTTGAGGARLSETVWNVGSAGSGGGVSTQYKIPGWQQNISMAQNQGSSTMRNIPDVALTAQNVYVRADATDHNVGGTSCAAPLWAGFAALVNQQASGLGHHSIGFINPAVYAMGSAANYTSLFNDITTGNNVNSSSPTKYYAVAGYDLCTGLGTPSGQKLIDALVPPILVTLPLTVTEGDGVLSSAGKIHLPTAFTTNLDLTLTSSSPLQISVPTTVTLLAGKQDAAFNLTLLDDFTLDGSTIATVTVSVPGVGSGSASTTIFDKETATLQVSLPGTATKGMGTVLGSVQVDTPVGADVSLGLSSDATNLLQVPASVTIPSGQTSATFTAVMLTDGQINGGRTVTVTAHVQNWTSGTASITVQDNLNLAVSLPSSTWEDAGLLTKAGAVRLAGTSAVDQVITLTSDNPSKVVIPATVTIYAGSLSNLFNITPVNITNIEGHQVVTVTASAPGLLDGSASMIVLDRQSPPFPNNPNPANFATETPILTNLAWNATELILNGGFENGSLANWDQASAATGRFTINDGKTAPAGPGGLFPPCSGKFSALGSESGAGTFYLYQTVTIPGGSTSATLSWAHLLRNYYTAFSSAQQFQVRICDINNNVLATPFTTKPGDTLVGGWVNNTYNMAPYIGKTVRVMFWVSPGSYYLYANVDNVSLLVNNGAISANASYDVYFGTNPTPGPAEFQGSTTNTSWALPRLASLTTYYWQILAHQGGSATGAVWQFTTSGVDHFAWDSIPSPQILNHSFTTTITAQDAYNGTVTNFTGFVSLTAGSTGGLTTNQILSSPKPDSSGSGNYTLGYSFTPTNNLTVTHVRHYFGSKVSIWTDSGTLVASQGFTSTSGSWAETPLATPVQLTAGTRYRVAAYSGSGFYYYKKTPFTNFPDGTINQSVYVSGDAFPSGTVLTPWPMVDLRYTSGSADLVSITPTNTGNFVAGKWSGSVVVQQPATNLSLTADDGNKHTGTSTPFDVGVADDISIKVAASTNSVAAGVSLTYTLTIANSGPSDATGVTVTNFLPSNIAFSSALSTQGTCLQTAGVVTCDLGTVSSGTHATLTITVIPTVAGAMLTNVASVSRAEADNYLANNTATTVTTVTAPAISIADASITEGDLGITNMSFTVSLSAPCLTRVSVNYATANGSAISSKDYVARNGVLNFLAGVTTQTVTVGVIGNALIESAKTLNVTLSSPINATLGRSTAVGTIVNDDGLPGNLFRLQWSAIPSPQIVNQPFTVTLLALDASGNPATNFIGPVFLSSSLTTPTPSLSGNFTNGVWTGDVGVQAPAANLTIAATDGRNHFGTSNPFDAVTTEDLSILMEAASGTISVGSNLTYTLTVSNTGPSTATGVVVTNLVPPGTTFISATASQGSCTETNGIVTFDLGVVPGATNATISLVVVPTVAGTLFTNQAWVSRSEIDTYLPNNQASLVTQVNPPGVSITDASVLEGNAGPTLMTFGATLSAPAGQVVSVSCSTADGTALAGRDYLATNAVLTFQPGVTNAIVSVTVVGNLTIEADKSFLVNLSNPINAVIDRSQGMGTILNDDGLPGQLDHFTWSPIPFPVCATAPFNVTINALDASNNLATNFTSLVNFQCLSTRVLGKNLDFESGVLEPWTALNLGNSPGPYQLGLFDVSGKGVPSMAFQIMANSGAPDGITQPITLTGGTTYVVDMDIASSNANGLNDDGGTTALLIGDTTVAQYSFGQISQGTLRNHLHGTYTCPVNGVYPLTVTFSRRYYQVSGLWSFADNLSVVGSANINPVTPTISANFTNGTWTGALTIQNRDTNVLVSADDGNGHLGFSDSFDVAPYQMPPVLLTQPGDQTCFIRSSNSLAVTADGTPSLTYQWFFEGQNLTGATNASLVLSSLQYAQAGNYFVVVSNAFGIATSSNALLAVISYPPIATPDGVGFMAGTQEVSFNVLANDRDLENAPLTVQSFTLPSQGTLTQITNGQFTYSPKASFMEGQDQFQYEIVNGHGGRATGTVTLRAYSQYLGGGEWPTFGNGPSHTGYYPGLLQGTTLIAGWSTNFGNMLNQVAVGNGHVYVTPWAYFGATYLTALDAASGQPVWQHDFASAFSINPPTFDHDKVYVQRGNASDTQLWCIDAATGKANWSAPHSAQWERYLAPTVYGDGIWVDGGTYGGMYGFSTNGTQRFFVSLDQLDEWTPTYYEGVIYSWVGGKFRAHDPMTGSTIWTLPLGSTRDGWNTVSAADGGMAFVQQSPNLIAINLTTHSNAWTVGGGVKGTPAVANGIVYAIIGDGVQAFSAATGASLGVYEATNDTEVTYQPIVTDDSLFVASPSYTYVFDLASHRLLQTLPCGGTLSLANGWLYMAGQDGSLNAYHTTFPPRPLDHFAWDSIPSPQFVGVPFEVTVKAQDSANQIVANFTGTVSLSSTNGTLITPTASGNFVSGLWTGTITVSQPTTALVLRADAGTNFFALANPIDIASLPALEENHAADGILFNWPLSSPGFVLEATPSLSPAQWIPLGPPAFETGGYYFQYVPISAESNSFFRLHFNR